MKRTYITLLLAAVAMCTFAAAPNSSGDYYKNADGKKGAALKTALRGIIYNRTEKGYDYLWTFFNTYDVRSDGKIWDMYSNTTNYEPGGSAQGHNYQGEGDSYNREHSFPKSWFNSNTPMYTDLHHMYPTDGFVNNKRSNYPFGTTNGEDYKSNGDFCKLGACTYSGYSGTVFEPNDMYKGDFARTYFYMVTCYEEKLADWYAGNADGVRATIDGSTYPAFTAWQKNMLLEWAAADPVSQKEIDRNNAIYTVQKNRNPFIDYPGLEQYIWGTKTDVAFSYDNYDGSGSGDDPDPGTDPDPSLAGTYKLTITAADFNGTSYAGNNNEKTSLAVCTTDASKTYEVKWTSYQVMLQNSKMQWQKNAGYIYNSTDLGTINSVTVTSSAGTFTTYYGTSEQPSSSTTVGGGYFKTMVGNATGTSSQVEVVFTIADGGDDPGEEPFEGNYFTKITSMDDFEDGGTYLIVYETGSVAFNGALTALDAANNNIPVTISDNKIEVSPDVMAATFTITSKTGGYSVKSASGYYIGNTSKSNALKSSRSNSYTNEIAFNFQGNVYIQSSSTYLYFYSQSGQSRFRYFTSSQKDIQLYKLIAPSAVSVTVSELGCGTFASDYALDFSSSEIRAFYATVSGDNLIFHEVEKVPANTGVLLYKVGGASDDIPVYSGTADAVTGNAFVRGTGAAVSYTDDDKNYILFDGDDGLGFYKAKNNMVATDRAYIHVPVSVNVKCFLLDLENDPTGIRSMEEVRGMMEDGVIYNLAGQRLQKMQKGINIVNGKKVLR